MMNGVSYADRLEAFRKSDAERDALVAAIVQELDQLKIKCREQEDDYQNEIASRRMWQAKATQCEQALVLSKQESGSNNFVVALIDGDGAVFQDYLYAMGKDGGADAAHQLHTELRKHLKEIYPDANVSDWNIVVQVILNMQGLGNKLNACNIISNPNELSSFGRAFGLAQPLFSFVDVGGGKERADHKIRETLRMFLPIAQCKHVFFAPCHDNGYLPVLEPYRRDSTTASRLTLIETRPPEPGFMELGLKMIRFPRIFRSDNLPTFRPIAPPSVPSYTPTVQTPATPARTPSIQNSCSPFLPTAAPVPKSVSPAPSTESMSSATNSASWATIGKSGTSAAKNISIAPKKSAAKARPHTIHNVYGDRLDAELPKSDPGAEARFLDRTKQYGKCCNAYHLTGKCDSGEYCDYVHGEKLSPGELLVLKHKARSRSCTSKLKCRDYICTFGHHCKYGQWCKLDWCYFSDTHDIDLEPAKRIYMDGTEEWIPSYLAKHGH